MTDKRDKPVRRSGPRDQRAGISRIVHGLENLTGASDVTDEELDQYAEYEKEAERLGGGGTQRIGSQAGRRPADEDTDRGHKPSYGGRGQDQRPAAPGPQPSSQQAGPAPQESRPTTNTEEVPGMTEQLSALERLERIKNLLKGGGVAQRIEVAKTADQVAKTANEVIDLFLEHPDPAHDPEFLQAMCEAFGLSEGKLLEQGKMLKDFRTVTVAEDEHGKVPPEQELGFVEHAARIGAVRFLNWEQAEDADNRDQHPMNLPVPLRDRAGKVETWPNGNVKIRWVSFIEADLDVGKPENKLRIAVAHEIRRIHSEVGRAVGRHRKQEERSRDEERKQESDARSAAAEAKTEEMRSSATLATMITVEGKEEIRVADIKAIEAREPGTFYLPDLLTEITTEGKFRPVEYTEEVRVALEKTSFFTTEGGVDFDTFVKTHRNILLDLRRLAQKQRMTLTGVWIQHDKPETADVAAEEAATEVAPIEDSAPVATPLSTLKLSPGTLKALEAAGVTSTEELSSKTDEELLAIKYSGQKAEKAVAQIRKAQS